jgi:hypothetical protein
MVISGLIVRFSLDAEKISENVHDGPFLKMKGHGMLYVSVFNLKSDA